MARIKPFKGIRPPVDLVEKVQCRPYDVLSSIEARAEAENNQMSLYHIIKPEIDFPIGTDEYDERVYTRAAENFADFQRKGWLVQDDKEMYYIYAQTMRDKTQYGLVVAAAVEDYVNGVIKKHELTRRDKEEDRMRHVRITKANLEPVFFAYPDNSVLDVLVKRYVADKPVYDFVAPDDGFRHRFWKVDNSKDIVTITEAFSRIPYLYIADGHHRSAAAALVGEELARKNPLHRGDEEYNYFMAVCFPAGQLTVLDYNRVVRDLNGLDVEQFLDAVSVHFHVSAQGHEPYRPQRVHEFGMYLNGMWYALSLKAGCCDEADPIDSLDVSVSSKYILDEILDIKDLRSGDRIDFVGGVRGLSELQRRVDSGEMALALALYPVTMKQIMEVADSGNIMPPKATWFEPKLRSGLVVKKLSE